VYKVGFLYTNKLQMS